MKQIYDDHADIRTKAAIRVVSLFFVGLIIIAATTSPIATGTKAGERAPPLEGKFYNGTGGWTDFNLENYWDPTWEEGDVSGQWVVIDFMDTDCPYCIRSAEDVSINSGDFDGSNPQWDGAIVNFIASATELDINGHDSSRAEIAAFRDKTADSGQSCGGSDCGNRAGSAHNFPYIDDIDQENMKEWKVGGTPSYYLIQPDGIIAWSSSENPGEDLRDAILALVPRESAQQGGA
ncbi:MAG: redoxin domain-containing protein [Candidatus Poseidoniaceae archaeon]|nr:redoxin domain-containing protein [Candidatus Poseidoniaceae archaeon]